MTPYLQLNPHSNEQLDPPFPYASIRKILAVGFAMIEKLRKREGPNQVRTIASIANRLDENLDTNKILKTLGGVWRDAHRKPKIAKSKTTGELIF